MNKNKSSVVVRLLLVLVMIAVSFFSMRSADVGLNVAYILLGISILVVLVFALVKMIAYPKSGIGFLLSLVFLVITFFVAYSMSDGSITSNGMVTTETSKFVGGSLGMLYILGGLTVLVTVLGEIWSMIK